MPAASSAANPRPSTTGLGSAMAETTRTTPARATARALVEPLAPDAALGHEHGTDQRVGRGEPPPPLGKPQGPLEVRLVVHHEPFSGRDARERGHGHGPASAGAGTARPLPSRLSRSVPESHRVHPRVALGGSRTVTAGGDLHPAPKTSSSFSV